MALFSHTLVTTTTNVQETIQTREIVTVRNVHRKVRRKEIQAQEDELEDNPGYEASNARLSLCGKSMLQSH